MPTFRVRLRDGRVITHTAGRIAWSGDRVALQNPAGSGRWGVVAAYDKADVDGVQRRAVEYDRRYSWVTQRDPYDHQGDGTAGTGRR